MTQTVRTAQASALKKITGSWAYVNVGYRSPIAMSKTRDAIFGSFYETLAMATDELAVSANTDVSVANNASWTDLHVFPQGQSVRGLIETSDGECLVLCDDGTYLYVYRSTGWTANRGAATWALKFTSEGGQARGKWSFNAGNYGPTTGVVCFNEYGAQTQGNAGDATRARRLYVSTDHGVTWAKKLDLQAAPNGTTGAVGVHMHACCYDEAWNRIWATFGDGTGSGQTVAGDGNAQVFYSDDHGTTWTPLPFPEGYAGLYQYYFQRVAVRVVGDWLVMLPDGLPAAIVAWHRTGYRTMGAMRTACYFEGHGGASNYIGGGISQNPGRPNDIVFASNDYNATKPARVFASPDGCYSWQEVFVGQLDNVNQDAVVGPTAGGRCFLPVYNGSGYIGPNGSVTALMGTGVGVSS